MGQIEDSAESEVYVPKDVYYAIYQEYGFTVRSKDGSETYVPPKWYMRDALKQHEESIKRGVVGYIQSGLRSAQKVSIAPYLQQMARIVQRTAKGKAPVDTGLLRASVSERTRSRKVN